ncbi:hypothetical protein FACS1894178_8000 [Bacteroidia bacterium]|nr:hypothetical protein FACS1894178_8000 [Bacteroidia bacterium]
MIDKSGDFGLIDNLTFSYTGNQMLRVVDNANTVLLAGSEDFKDYADYRTEYSYDANGNMTMDKNKGILSIEYNFVNLPKKIAISSPVAEGTIEYIYAADGRKLQSKQTWYPLQSNVPISNSNRAKPQAPQTMTKTYCSNIIFECKVQNAECKMQILTENGYIKDGMYHYFVKDYLGNNRLVMDEYAVIIQQNNYYPFGMTQLVDAEQQDAVPYKFSGKELESDGGLNWYDFAARFYDASTGRFGQIDPMAEKYYPISPYAYCANNPVKYIDPNGMDVYLTGEAAQEAFRQLQRHLERKVTLSINEEGRMSYTLNEGQKLKGNAKKIAKMIDDKNITVHVLATEGVKTSTGENFNGGAFMGNTVTKDENGRVTHVDAFQEVNPIVLGAADDFTKASGRTMMHEVTEAYEGAKISQESGENAMPARGTDINNPESVYSRAHNRATPQTPIHVRYFDSSGNRLYPLPNGIPPDNTRLTEIYVQRWFKSLIILTR